MYAKGASALGMCDSCGQRAPLRLLVPDGYKKGLLVHRHCRDEPHPQEKPVRLSEGIALKNPRPDRDDDSVGDTGETLVEAMFPNDNNFGGGT